MFKKIPLKGGLEFDIFTSWRHYLCYIDNTKGITKYGKRKYNKRFRQKAKQELLKKDFDEI